MFRLPPTIALIVFTNGASLKPYALLPKTMMGLKSEATGLDKLTCTIEFCASIADVLTAVMVRFWARYLVAASGSLSLARGEASGEPTVFHKGQSLA